MRALFFISFIECAQARSWPLETQQPLLLDAPLPLNPPDPYPIIGIHLGPNLIRAAVVHNQSISLIPFEHGTLSMPNILSFNSDPPLVGHEVTRTNATNNVYGIERLIGRRFDDPVVQEAIKEAAFKILDVDGEVRVEVEKEFRGKRYLARISPEEMMGMLLGRLKKFAVEYVGEVTEAVVTVPADWDDAQRVCHIHTLKALQIVCD
jgi:molecular chaperone DnaK (HSP70)